MPKACPIFVDGVRYVSIHEFSRESGVHLGTIRERLLSSNFTNYAYEDESKRVVMRSPHCIPCSVNGVEYNSIADAARDLGIGSKVVLWRLQSSLYPTYVSDRYEKVEIQKNHNKRCMVDGVVYKTVTEAGEALNLSRQCVYQRMQSHKYPNYTSPFIEKTCGFKDTFTIEGVEYRTRREIAEAYGISVQTIGRRLKSKKYPQWISPNIDNETGKKLGYRIGGKHYNRMTDASKDTGMSVSTIKQRIRSQHFPDYHKMQAEY